MTVFFCSEKPFKIRVKLFNCDQLQEKITISLRLSESLDSMVHTLELSPPLPDPKILPFGPFMIKKIVGREAQLTHIGHLEVIGETGRIYKDISLEAAKILAPDFYFEKRVATILRTGLGYAVKHYGGSGMPDLEIAHPDCLADVADVEVTEQEYVWDKFCKDKTKFEKFKSLKKFGFNRLVIVTRTKEFSKDLISLVSSSEYDITLLPYETLLMIASAFQEQKISKEKVIILLKTRGIVKFNHKISINDNGLSVHEVRCRLFKKHELLKSNESNQPVDLGILKPMDILRLLESLNREKHNFTSIGELKEMFNSQNIRFENDYFMVLKQLGLISNELKLTEAATNLLNLASVRKHAAVTKLYLALLENQDHFGYWFLKKIDEMTANKTEACLQIAEDAVKERGVKNKRTAYSILVGFFDWFKEFGIINIRNKNISINWKLVQQIHTDNFVISE